MNENDDDTDNGREYARLDETLRHFLAAELDGQLGRARSAFEAHAARSGRPATFARFHPRRTTRARLWAIGLAGAGAAMAASLAAVWAVPMFGKKSSTTAFVSPVPTPTSPSSKPAELTPIRTSAEIDWHQLRQVDTSKVVDQGTLVVGGAPARVVKSVSTERTEWFDPERNIHVETSVPQERVMLIGIDTY
jgi:hypothetical protein